MGRASVFCLPLLLLFDKLKRVKNCEPYVRQKARLVPSTGPTYIHKGALIFLKMAIRRTKVQVLVDQSPSFGP